MSYFFSLYYCNWFGTSFLPSQIVQLLVTSGANLDLQELTNRRTALVAAVENDFHEAAHLLIDKGERSRITQAATIFRIVG